VYFCVMHRLVSDRSPWATRMPNDRIDNITIRDFNNPFNRFTVLLRGREDIARWLMKEGLLADKAVCDRCQTDCRLSVRERTIDGLVWRCSARHEVSVRRWSFFEKSHLHIPDVINFLITYAEGQSLWRCSQIAGVGYGSTAVDWGSFCRDLFAEYYVKHVRDEQFTGEVEIDESLFGRRTKYHRGDPRGLKVWIFGLVERHTNRLKVFPVDRRDAATVIPIIQQNVAPGCTVITDGWAAYAGLGALGYTHYVVEHKKAFTCQCRDQSTGQVITVHTNRIEGAWKHAKDYFRRMNGTKVTQFESHLCELMWRWWDRRPRPEAILCLIKEFYPLTGPPAFTAGYPIFNTWSRQGSDSLEDSMSRIDSSEGEDDDSAAGSSRSAAASAQQSASDTSAVAEASNQTRLLTKRHHTAVSSGVSLFTAKIIIMCS